MENLSQLLLTHALQAAFRQVCGLKGRLILEALRMFSVMKRRIKVKLFEKYR